LDFEIPVFLDSLTDCIESNNEIEIEDIDKQRNTEPLLIRYECEGSILITIKRSHRLVYIPPEIKEYIQQNKLLTVPQIYRNIKALRLNGYLHITQQQVYYWCKYLGLNEYKIAKDQVDEAHAICSVIDPTWELDLNNDMSDKFTAFCRKDFRDYIIKLIKIHFSLHPLISTEN
ncbi:4850_t:CDS:2, partial [Racocetra fulgida]